MIYVVSPSIRCFHPDADCMLNQVQASVVARYCGWRPQIKESTAFLPQTQGTPDQNSLTRLQTSVPTKVIKAPVHQCFSSYGDVQSTLMRTRTRNEARHTKISHQPLQFCPCPSLLPSLLPHHPSPLAFRPAFSCLDQVVDWSQKALFWKWLEWASVLTLEVSLPVKLAMKKKSKERCLPLIHRLKCWFWVSFILIQYRIIVYLHSAQTEQGTFLTLALCVTITCVHCSVVTAWTLSS